MYEDDFAHEHRYWWHARPTRHLTMEYFEDSLDENLTTYDVFVNMDDVSMMSFADALDEVLKISYAEASINRLQETFSEARARVLHAKAKQHFESYLRNKHEL